MNLDFSDKTFACTFVVSLFLAGVAFAQTKNTKKPVSSSTGIMSFEEYVKKPHPVPYVLRLSAGKGRLLYFGAKHTYDPNDAEISQIEKWWLKLNPEVAFFEGADPEASPAIVKSREEIGKNGEPSFVLFLAARDNVPVHSLEPTQRAEIALLLKRHSPEEVKIFYVLRQIPEFRSGKHDETVEAYTNGVLAWLSAKPELQGKPRTIAELKVISARLFPQLAEWRDVPQEWFDPTQAVTYLNEVSRQLSEFRDQHMLTLLTEQLAQGKRVFAVVGASHVVMQERALRAAIRAKKSRQSLTLSPRRTTRWTGARVACFAT
jgi:hypothetical protein